MSHHALCVLPNGNVLVSTVIDGDIRQARQEYFRRGQRVYRIQLTGAPLQMAAQLGAKGKPLRIRRGETLHDTIRRALDERDGIRKPASRLQALYEEHPMASDLFLVAAACAAALAVSWLFLR